MEQQKNSTKPAYKNWKLYAATVCIFFILVFYILIFSVLTLRWVNPSVTSFTMQENWENYETERYNLKEHWVPYNEIPEHLKWAVIASEDQLFWEHRGFDIESIREAWQQRKTGERNRGASTITQQVAKNLYLWPAHSFFRKGLEAGITILIELFWPKERILEVYLNIAEFGPGIYGAAKAADSFYSITVTALEPEMSALLAAVLPNPKRMRVNPPSPFAKERSLWVLRQMTHLSGIAYLPDSDPEPQPDPLLLDGEFIFDQPLWDTNFSDQDSLPTRDSLELYDLPDSLLHDSLIISPVIE